MSKTAVTVSIPVEMLARIELQKGGANRSDYVAQLIAKGFEAK